MIESETSGRGLDGCRGGILTQYKTVKKTQKNNKKKQDSVFALEQFGDEQVITWLRRGNVTRLK